MTTKIRIRDIDPIIAPDHTLDDNIRSLKAYALMSDHRTKGFTRDSLRVVLRCDDNTRRSLVNACLAAGYLVEKGGRLFPQDSLQSAKHAEIHEEVAFLVKEIPCKKGACEYSILTGKCFVEVCSICGNSTTHHPSEESAWERIRRWKYHSGRKAHKLTQGVSLL